MTWLAFLVLTIAFFIIPKFSNLIVFSLVKLARELHVSDFSIGFFILGLATTTPELFVGINSSLSSHSQLSLGNLIGASILLLSFIIGLLAVITKQVIFIRTFTRRDMWLTSFIIFCPAFLLLDKTLSRLDGLFLICFYIVFFLILNKQQTFWEHIHGMLFEKSNHILKIILTFTVGIIGLLITTKVVVATALLIAVSWHLPEVVIGLLMLAIGTNLPEMTVMISSIRQAHKQISIGDFLGSAVANTLVLGIVVMIKPIIVNEPSRVFFSLAMLLVILLTFNLFFAPDKKISRSEGIVLLALYSFFLFSEVLINK